MDEEPSDEENAVVALIKLTVSLFWNSTSEEDDDDDSGAEGHAG